VIEVETDRRFDQWVARLELTPTPMPADLTPVQRRVLRLLRRRGHAMWRWEVQRELGFLPRTSTCAALVRRGLVCFTNQGLLRV
jgi:hypothetical protein